MMDPMAKETITHVTDDLDGSKDAQEVSFSFQGVDYTIDLGKKNLASLEKALKPYLEAATKAPRRAGAPARRRSSRASGSGRDLTAIREWAKASGIEVAERGRISQGVIDQYDAAQS